MAWSPYWPHPIYLDTFIVFTYLITGCNASEVSGEMIGIIAGSILAFILLVLGIVGIVYWIIKSQRSKKSKKQQVMKTSNDIDYRTVVVRQIPAASVRHPTMVGYPEVMVGYHTTVRGEIRPKIPMISHMSTIGHMPVQRPASVPMVYYTSRPRKLQQTSREKFIEDRKSKRKSRSRSKQSVSNSKYSHEFSGIEANSLKDFNSWTLRESQFILRKKEDSFKQIEESSSKPNEPYTLTSLFSRNRESFSRPEPGSQTPESRYFLTAKDGTSKEEAETYEPVGFPLTYLQQPNPTQPQRTSLPPERADSPERDFEIKDNSDAERPVTPDYDTSSIMDEEVANTDISFTNGNKFSYAASDELKQNSRFRLSSNGTEDPMADLFGNASKQVQFNPSSFQDADSSIETSNLNPGSYGNIPAAPPLPSS